MKKLAIIYIFLFITVSGFSQVTSTQLIVTFDHDSYTLSTESKNAINTLLEEHEGLSDVYIDVSGFADATGSEDYNKALSMRRAEAVKTFIESKGFHAKSITVNGYGEAHPMASNDDEVGRSMNRRARVVVEYIGSGLATKPIKTIPVITTKTSKRLMKTPYGIEVFAGDNVKVRLEETVGKTAMIENDMPTNSTEGPLESTYMACVSATENGRPMRDGKVQIAIPAAYFEGNVNFYSKGNKKETDWNLVDGTPVSYQDSCDCYLTMVEPGTCFNCDRVVPPVDPKQVLITYSEKVKVGTFLFIFPKYKKVDPKFYLVYDDFNTVLAPAKKSEGKLHFEGVNNRQVVTLTATVKVKGKEYAINESFVVQPNDQGVCKKGKLKFTPTPLTNNLSSL